MLTTPEEIQDFYKGEDEKFLKDSNFVQILLNGMREHADRYTHMMETVKRLQPVRILDIGCSRGTLGAMYRWQRGYAPHEVHGVDISPISAMFAKEFCGYDAVHVLDASQEFRLNNVYDLVICTELLEHVPDPEKLAFNICRHSDKNILISTPAETDIDGVVHVRHVSPEDQVRWFSPYLKSFEQHFLESKFGEKPHWLGWNFLIGEVRS